MPLRESDSDSTDDPLLAFAAEDRPEQASAQPDESAAGAEVAPPAISQPAPGADHDLRVRIDRLEKAVEAATAQIASLSVDVATLVGATSDISKRVGRRPQPAPQPPRVVSRRWPSPSAVAGIAIGVLLGLWFWTATSTEPLAPEQPVSASAIQPPASTPEKVVAPAAAVVPAAAATAAGVAETSPPPAVVQRPSTPASPRRTEYVGTLTIDSDPPGEVFIDRNAAGRTPLRATNLRAGSHLIWIEREGYRRFTRVVQVPADRISRVSVGLEPLPIDR